MGLNREHVIWQSADKTWNIGFFDFVNVGESDPDWDYEWDVEYDHTSFWWASTGHSTPDKALESYPGANPGGENGLFAYKRGNTRLCKEYDEMVKCFRSPEYAAAKRLKDQRAKVRNNAKKALKEFRENTFGENSMVRVQFGSSVSQSTVEGALQKDGDWLVIRSRDHVLKVYNTKTDAMWIGVKNKAPIGIVAVQRRKLGF